MKKNILLFAFLFVVGSMFAQINFEHGTWAQVLEKSKKENKPIFVDAYTTWCGPCKAMARTTFKNDTVSKFYNEKFINYKIDAEKGEGVAFANKYEVNCYPNLLIIDSNGQLLHRAAGYLQTNEFITYGENGLSKDKNFNHFQSEFEKGGLKKENVLTYMELMRGACLNADSKVLDYLKTVPENELIDNINWNVFCAVVKDANSREANYFYLNYKTFEEKYSKETVRLKAIDLGMGNFQNYFTSKNPDFVAYEKEKSSYLTKKQPYCDEIVFFSDVKLFKKHKVLKYYDIVTLNWEKYLNTNHSTLNSFAWDFYEGATDKKHLQAAANMAAKACELNPNYAYYDTFAAVQYKLKNYAEAKKLVAKAIDFAKQEGLEATEYQETTDLVNKIDKELKK